MLTRRTACVLAAAVLLIGCTEREVTNPDALTLGVTADLTVLDPDMVQLGKNLFFDENLSINQNQSCASCHDPAWGFTGPDADINAHGAVYMGSIDGRFGNRKPPSSAYATQSPILHYDGRLFIGGNFWDGRATGERLGNPAADQARGPFLNPLEQALPDEATVVARVCASAYGDLFREVWGETACESGYVEMAYDAIALSIATFEMSPESNAFSSKYDASLAGTADLTKLEKTGLAIFRGKGKCQKCHVLGKGHGKEPALFTDFTFDNLGVPANPENPFYTMDPAFNPDGANWIDLGLGGFLASRPEYAALAPDFEGQHKVPTLRNVDLRPDPTDVKPTCPCAYTAEQAMAADCWPAPEVATNVNTAELGDLGLDPDEEAALVAFLRTLSDGYMAP
jgi:cytochrome c peroxidase